MARLRLAISNQSPGAGEYKHARNPRQCQGRDLGQPCIPQIIRVTDPVRGRWNGDVAAHVGRQRFSARGWLSGHTAGATGNAGATRRPTAASETYGRRNDDRQRDRRDRKFRGRCADARFGGDRRRFCRRRQLHLGRQFRNAWRHLDGTPAATAATSGRRQAEARVVVVVVVVVVVDVVVSVVVVWLVVDSVWLSSSIFVVVRLVDFRRGLRWRRHAGRTRRRASAATVSGVPVAPVVAAVAVIRVPADAGLVGGGGGGGARFSGGGARFRGTAAVGIGLRSLAWHSFECVPPGTSGEDEGSAMAKAPPRPHRNKPEATTQAEAAPNTREPTSLPPFRASPRRLWRDPINSRTNALHGLLWI